MAFIQVNFMSKALMRTVNVNVIIPADKIFVKEEDKQPKKYKTLYLLHGVFGSQVDWINGTKLQRWAEASDLAVVMPAGENKFYVDNPRSGDNFEQFISKELVEFTRKIFPLSDKKEDTFIAGLSMGGYGALFNGLRAYDTFGYVAGLSSANILDNHVSNNVTSDAMLESIFGDLKEAEKSDFNIINLIKHNSEDKKTDQKIYLCIGVDDSLLEVNRRLYKTFEEAGYDVTYEEGPGAHEWDFWNEYIKHIIDWLPLAEAAEGINSGNVSK